MKKLNKIFLPALFFFVSVAAANGQTEAMKNLRAKDNEYSSRFQYVYESMLRAVVNVATEDNYSDMLEGVRLVVVFSDSEDSEFLTPELKQSFRDDLKKENFELLMEMDQQGAEFEFMKKGEGAEIEHLVILYSDSTNWSAVDVTGEIDISKIMSIGPGKLQELMQNF